MKKFFFLFLFFTSYALAKGPLDNIKELSADISKEQLEQLQKAHEDPLTSTPNKITPKVDPISGVYCEEENDLTLSGSEPLSLRRFFTHLSPHDPRYGGWIYNPEHFAVANLEFRSQNRFVSIGEEDGSMRCYDGHVNPTNGQLIKACVSKKKEENTLSLPSPSARHHHKDHTKKPTATSIYAFSVEKQKEFFKIPSLAFNGQNHPLNTKILYNRDEEDSELFEYQGEIVDGSGKHRLFKTPRYNWLSDKEVFWGILEIGRTARYEPFSLKNE